MLVSVIIPTYNREILIGRAIESVLKQTYSQVEVLVVDDGSTDSTQKVVLKYIQNYGNKVRYFHQENSGVSSARNLGIEKANGEYISFLDSDDYLFVDKIEKQIGEIIEDKADACYCGYILLDEKGIQLGKSKIKYKKGNILLNYLQNKTNPDTNSWVIKKNLFEQYHFRFRENYSWREDMELFSKLLLYAKVTYVKDYLTATVIHSNVRLSDLKWNQVDADIFIWNEVWQWLGKHIKTEFQRKKVKKAILGYRLPAFIIYRLDSRLAFESEETKKNFFSNHEYIRQLDFSNGLRSIKAWLYYMKFRIRLYFYRND